LALLFCKYDFKKYKCIFIHIPKTAGTSIENKLGHFVELSHNVQDHRILSEIELNTDAKLNIRKIAYVIKRGKWNRIVPAIKNYFKPVISRKTYYSYFKFAVVRNSWSRMFSYYQMTLRNSSYTEDPADKQHFLSFKNYLLHHTDPEFMSQMRYIKDRNGKIPLDYIIRFEKVQEGFDLVGSKIGMEDTELPKLLMWKQKDYSKYYDDQTIEIVRKLFKEEIDYFKFKFGE